MVIGGRCFVGNVTKRKGNGSNMLFSYESWLSEVVVFKN